MNLLVFAGAREVVGAAEMSIELAAEPCTAGQLMDQLCAQFAELDGYRGSLRLAVNGHYVEADAPIVAGDEVALIPPVAGG